MVGVALGSDGGGSIRIPAAFCGLFGHQAPARPHLARAQARGAGTAWASSGRWRGAWPTPRCSSRRRAGGGGFVEAAAREPGRLRVAVSTKLPPGALARLGRRAAPARSRTTADAPALARPRGRRARDRLRAGGLAEPGGALPARDPRRRARRRAPRAPRAAHARRWRGSARSSPPGRSRGRAPPRRRWRRASTRSSTTPTSSLTPGPSGPPFRVGQFHGRGALWTLNADRRRGCRTTGVFNVTGQPAASVPAGLRRATACRSPSSSSAARGDEATLLSLAAQIEQARPWADRRPPL